MVALIGKLLANLGDLAGMRFTRGCDFLYVKNALCPPHPTGYENKAYTSCVGQFLC